MKPIYQYIKNDHIFYKWLYNYLFYWKEKALQSVQNQKRDVKMFEYLIDCLSSEKIKESLSRWLQTYQFSYQKAQMKMLWIDFLFLHKEFRKNIWMENLFFSLYVFSHAWFIIQVWTWNCILSNDYEKVVDFFAPLISTLHNIHNYLQTKTQQEQQKIFSQYWIFFMWLFSLLNSIEYVKTNTVRFEYWKTYINDFINHYIDQIQVFSWMYRKHLNTKKSLKLDFYVNSKKYKNEQVWSFDVIINSFWNRFKEYNTSLWFNEKCDSIDRLLSSWIFAHKVQDWDSKKILYIIDDWEYWSTIMNNTFRQKLTFDLYKKYVENISYEKNLIQKYKDRINAYRYDMQFVLSTTFSIRNTPYNDLVSFLKNFHLNLYRLQIIFVCFQTYLIQLQEDNRWNVDFKEIETLLEDFSTCILKMMNWLKDITEETKNDEFFQRAYNLEEYKNILEYLFQKVIEFNQIYSDLYSNAI